MLLFCACSACASAQKPACTRIETVVVPATYIQPEANTTLAPVARGTISLGSVETASGLPTPPSAVGGGPPADQTSVGPMSPTSVTGADSPLDASPTAPPAGNQPGNPLTTGSATSGGAPPTR